MQKQTSLYIPKPCHEDWNTMTPTQQGKFCSACSKQVIDFSLMSDHQILNVLSHQSGKLCGRFDAEQLQRPLIETKIKKKKSWWMALTMPLLFLFERSEAQDTRILKDTTHYEMDTTVLMGAVARIVPDKQIVMTGKVVDENNNPLAFASVVQKGTIHGTTTDSLGNFSTIINSYDDSATLTASFIGFSSTDKTIRVSDKNSNDIIINLKEQSMSLSEVVVIGEAYSSRAGGLSVCYKITTAEKVDTLFKKLIGISNVYPNPAMRGNLIHLKIKNAGKYQMQLLDNQSRLMQAEEINTEADNTTTQIQLSSNIAAGVYYLRLINEQTKKQHTEKLIIQ